MPRLPKEEIKIVVRPKGGLDIVKVGSPTVIAAIFAAAGITGDESVEDTVCPNLHQNIVDVSTPKRTNADRNAKMRQIHIQGTSHDVNAYETAPDNTTKGVIRGFPIEDGPRALDENIVNPINPLALAAKRIGTTTTVVIAFDGLKVPNLVRYGATLVRCTLYSKLIDICYQCGRLGYRMNVCSNSANPICRGCGVRNPGQGHQCSPKRNLCDGSHMTADKACKARCHECQATFVQKTHLVGHMRTHTGEKPFRCPDCPKAYASRSGLIKHRFVTHFVRGEEQAGQGEEGRPPVPGPGDGFRDP
ncbi:hypothetical protein V5799_022982 [Amblyomma americanum]|uniref:C2H2-type domain-containing protein n=1 Tax=Amblyomma americanum TaxID=6943 RepID=A0AAQ4FKG6_AMBAM